MAEVSIESLVTPKKDELDEGCVSQQSSGDQDSLSNGRSTDTRHRITSVGSNHAGSSSLRSSAEKSESANSKPIVVPHYLRASTGSCHDLCKFGRGHSAETKERKPFRKRIGKPFPYELSPVQILVSVGKKKEEVVSGGKKKEEVISVGKKKEEVVSGGKKKEDVISVGKKKEEVVSGGKKKEDVISVGKKKEEVVSGGKKKEDVISVGKKKEEVVSGGKKKEEGVSVGKKKEAVVSGGKKKGDVVSVGRKKEEVVSIGQKKGEVVSDGQKKDEVVSIGAKKEESVDDGTPTETKDHSAYEKPSSDTKSRLAKPKTSLDKEKATIHQPSTYTNSHSPKLPSSHNKSSLLKLKLSSYTKTYPSKQNDSSGNKTLLPKQKPSSAKKSPSADPPEIIKSVFFPYTEVAASAKQGSSSDNKISRTAKKTASVVKQHSSPVKLKPVKVKPSSSSDDSDGTRGKAKRNSNAETGRKLITSKVPAKKILAPPSALTSKLSLNNTAQTKSGKPGKVKSVSSLKDQNRIRRVTSNKASNGEKVSEKTLHVIRMETGNDVSESIPGDNAISSPPSPSSAKQSASGKSSSLSSQEEDISESEESDVEVDELIPEKNDSLETDQEAAVKEINKKTMRKIRVVVPEDKHTSPVKVKFRMGKVVDFQTDNNSPRKLRFRRARVLGAEDSKGDLRRRTLKKAGVNGDTAGTGDSSQKVVLKHQDVQGKKDAQGLLNNVIEETASKLAVSRKSKVKALVGAFETVISLQEMKPSTQVVS